MVAHYQLISALRVDHVARGSGISPVTMRSEVCRIAARAACNSSRKLEMGTLEHN